MRELTHEEVVEINGGAAEKERSAFDVAYDAVGNAIGGIVGTVSSWFGK